MKRLWCFMTHFENWREIVRPTAIPGLIFGLDHVGFACERCGRQWDI